MTWFAQKMAIHDPDCFTEVCKRCGARREEILDSLVPVCDPVAVQGLRLAQAQDNVFPSEVAAVAVPVTPEDRPLTRAILDEWTRRR